MPRPPERLSGRAAGGFVAARFDGLTILFDQGDIEVVEQAAKRPEYEAPVHRLSRALLPQEGAERPFFVIARHAGGAYGLACDEVRVLPAGRIELRHLPNSLRNERSPFDAYARIGGEIGFHCGAAGFAGLIREGGMHGQEQGDPA